MELWAWEDGLDRKKKAHIVEVDIRIFYKKLRSGAGREFLKFSGLFATKSFLNFFSTVIWGYLDHFSALVAFEFFPITFHLLLVPRKMEET